MKKGIALLTAFFLIIFLQACTGNTECASQITEMDTESLGITARKETGLQGQVVFSNALSELLQTGDSALAVGIIIEGITFDDDLESAFEYQGKTLSDYREQPKLVAYRTSYEAWLAEEYPTLDERNRNLPEWEKHSPQELYYQKWQESHTPEEISAYERAEHSYLEAKMAYSEWLGASGGQAAIQKLWQQECDRLNGNGFSLELVQASPTTYYMKGTATIAVLRLFPAEPGYAYCIWLADDDSPMPE